MPVYTGMFVLILILLEVTQMLFVQVLAYYGLLVLILILLEVTQIPK